MLGRGVKEGGKLHNLFYPPVRTERVMKGGKEKGEWQRTNRGGRDGIKTREQSAENHGETQERK